MDALGKHALTEWERDLKKPRMVVYSTDEVTSYDILGEKIPELSGPYTPDLKVLLDKHSDEKTQSHDAEDRVSELPE